VNEYGSRIDRQQRRLIDEQADTEEDFHAAGFWSVFACRHDSVGFAEHPGFGMIGAWIGPQEKSCITAR
jgi:hypothetical protein